MRNACASAWFILYSVAAPAPAPAAGFQFDTPTIMLSTADMERNGLMFPDGTMGFVRLEGDAPYLIFAAGGSFSGIGTWAHLPVGSYGFSGTLESVHPVRPAKPGFSYSMTVGRQQASPDGAEFDRDYAGGGPTYVMHLPMEPAPRDVSRERAGHPTQSPPRTHQVLLQIYHGEYHLSPPQGMPAYGGSGMAISSDNGATFEKIGQILAPHVDREEFRAAHGQGALWADGGMVEADVHGEHTCSIPHCSFAHDQFYYLIFTDHNSLAERYSGLSIARVRADELAQAILRHRAPVFRKYYNPTGMPTLEADYFTEPGIGGHSTPVVYAPNEYINTPGVLYDAYLKQFLVFYQVNQKQVVLRTSSNLMAWSPANVAFRVDATSDRRVYYPAVAGNGADPQIPLDSFYVYFLVRDLTAGRLFNPQLLRERVVATK